MIQYYLFLYPDKATHLVYKLSAEEIVNNLVEYASASLQGRKAKPAISYLDSVSWLKSETENRNWKYNRIIKSSLKKMSSKISQSIDMLMLSSRRRNNTTDDSLKYRMVHFKYLVVTNHSRESTFCKR